jgi:hypothetical protein
MLPDSLHDFIEVSRSYGTGRPSAEGLQHDPPAADLTAKHIKKETSMFEFSGLSYCLKI